jgi:hypothetical protein
MNAKESSMFGEPAARRQLAGRFVGKPLRAKREVVSQTFASWNLISASLLQIDGLRAAA